MAQVGPTEIRIGPQGRLVVPARIRDTLHLQPGDMLIMYSDGIPEAMNSQQELFTDAKLGILLAQCTTCSAPDVIDKVFAAAKAHAGTWPQSDDMTMVVLKRTTRD